MQHHGISELDAAIKVVEGINQSWSIQLLDLGSTAAESTGGQGRYDEMRWIHVSVPQIRKTRHGAGLSTGANPLAEGILYLEYEKIMTILLVACRAVFNKTG
ncbi:hypothetical protein [Halopseudomonas pelagia]|uniref:hypothetical protein n=1 Tax=Halopseudomonas pelagia TaxID=553151 RepID=UPI0003B50455|nr:hypothetical protein [Halopseudomonas pelagia]|tara:strand:+ start:573 stop:878 length:306 start_codon:yes stop_codon:yes gene_type:complete